MFHSASHNSPPGYPRHKSWSIPSHRQANTVVTRVTSVLRNYMQTDRLSGSLCGSKYRAIHGIVPSVWPSQRVGLTGPVWSGLFWSGLVWSGLRRRPCVTNGRSPSPTRRVLLGSDVTDRRADLHRSSSTSCKQHTDSHSVWIVRDGTCDELAAVYLTAAVMSISVSDIPYNRVIR